MKDRVMLSVVLPAHNEADAISHTLATLRAVLLEMTLDWEIIVVDDGSTDEMFSVVESIVAENSNVRGLRLSRNFGKEAAILAGLKASIEDIDSRKIQ